MDNNRMSHKRFDLSLPYSFYYYQFIEEYHQKLEEDYVFIPPNVLTKFDPGASQSNSTSIYTNYFS
ncbi:hypothetical protein VSS86_22470, partial [Bacillus safensis]|uniref:hypothetical protein n=1 Tax=Bacillus safensis TaxID=561879 RepID=UPI002DD427F9